MNRFLDIHRVDPYAGFDHTAFKHNVFGWHGSHPFIQEQVKTLKPSLIIEVGTWLGQSAIHMGRVIKEQGWKTQIICVDTWLGGVEHWDNFRNTQTNLHLVNGYPSLYYHFLANVVYEGLQDVIIPFPVPSSVAAQYFKRKDIKAQLIYIDGSHDEEDVLQDMRQYWPLLDKGGVMFGDDMDWWESVKCAVRKFGKEVSADPLVKDCFWWWVKK